jgi:16S rRNA processing protein RimM
MQGDRPILCCRELTSRDAIDVFKGQFIWAPRREIPIDDQNEYLWADLQGKQVLDAMGVVVGMIEGVTNFGATDILEIRGERGRLAIPLVSTYVDMSFQPDDATISLVVEAATFEEAWEDS